MKVNSISDEIFVFVFAFATKTLSKYYCEFLMHTLKKLFSEHFIQILGSFQTVLIDQRLPRENF